MVSPNEIKKRNTCTYDIDGTGVFNSMLYIFPLDK